MNWYLRVLRKYAVFSGRARRREFWWFTLIHLLLYAAFFALDWYRWGFFGLSPEEIQERAQEVQGMIGVTTIYGYAVLLPLLGVTVRRLHDSGRSGWWMMLPLGPQVVIWGIWLFTKQPFDPTAADPFSGLNMLFMLMSLIMMCGSLVLLVMMFLDGTVGPNRYGDDPKGRGDKAPEDVWPELG